MCVVSMVGDHYTEILPKKYPEFVDWETNALRMEITLLQTRVQQLEAGREEDRIMIRQLRADVEEMKALLVRAKEYDIKNDEPHCEMEAKVALLKNLAEALDIDLGDVFNE